MAVQVVVTGLGVVTGSSCGADPFAEAIRDTVAPCSEVDRGAGYHLPESARLAVLSRNVDLSAWIPPALARRSSRPSKLAVAAARLATEDAGLAGTAGGLRTTVVVSSAFGAVEYTEHLLRTLFLEGPQSVSPFTFAESVANAAAAQVAIACQAHGPNLTIVQREAGILTAVGRGAGDIWAGRADRALVGGVEEMPPILHALLDRFESLARPGNPGGEVARPFDRRRRGFLAAEGAVILVLENEEQARSRGATIRARVRAYGGAFDVSAPRIGWGRGHDSLAGALRSVLDRVGLAPRDIGRIVSGASGSLAGDRLEAHTLRAAWADSPLPPIIAPKGLIGQYGGGFLASAVMAARAQEWSATAGFAEPDPELEVTPHGGGPLPPADLTLVTSLASGGASSWLVLERV